MENSEKTSEEVQSGNDTVEKKEESKTDDSVPDTQLREHLKLLEAYQDNLFYLLQDIGKSSMVYRDTSKMTTSSSKDGIDDLEFAQSETELLQDVLDEKLVIKSQLNKEYEELSKTLSGLQEKLNLSEGQLQTVKKERDEAIEQKRLAVETKEGSNSKKSDTISTTNPSQSGSSNQNQLSIPNTSANENDDNSEVNSNHSRLSSMDTATTAKSISGRQGGADMNSGVTNSLNTSSVAAVDTNSADYLKQENRKMEENCQESKKKYDEARAENDKLSRNLNGVKKAIKEKDRELHDKQKVIKKLLEELQKHSKNKRSDFRRKDEAMTEPSMGNHHSESQNVRSKAFANAI